MRYVLFVCTHNAGRSQIAQAFFERYAPADIRAESAGEEPAMEIWPNVIEAMREVGIDISGRRPKKLDLEMHGNACACESRPVKSCGPSGSQDLALLAGRVGRPLFSKREVAST